jgi:hypothetical protein
MKEENFGGFGLDLKKFIIPTIVVGIIIFIVTSKN